MKIKELYKDERPRERLLKNGAESLSNVEQDKKRPQNWQIK